ncbi:non-homologous end-joining DNA ligase [Cupriavidus necator]
MVLIAPSATSTSDPITRGPSGPLFHQHCAAHPEPPLDRHVHQYRPVTADIGDGRCRSRPSITVLACPSNLVLTHKLFFQKHVEATALPGLTRHPASLWPGHGALLSVDSPEAIIAAAQLNAVEFHTWNSTVSRLECPDRVVFDLDPGEGVPWQHIQEAALLVQTLLSELGLRAWLKTSGGKGLHVVVPLAPELDYDTVKDFSRAAVRHLARAIPQRFVAKSGAGNRIGKIFVDYLRNGIGHTTAAAFSARARPGMGVSMPVSWEQLLQLKSADQWNVRNAREYLSFQATDPWSDFWSTLQDLTEAIERLS